MKQEKEFDLKKSVEKLGRLDPIKLAADGTVLDGNNRSDIDPAWKDEFSITLDHIKTEPQKIAAMLAYNTDRRIVPAEEKSDLLKRLVEATGWDEPSNRPDPEKTLAQTIADFTSKSLSWVYRYLPDEFKDEVKARGGKASKTVPQRVTEPIKMQRTQICYNCGLGALFPKVVPHPEKEGETVVLCLECGEKYERGQLTLKKRKPEPPSVKEAGGKPILDTWKYRKGLMSPTVSKMDLRIAKRLKKLGIHFEMQKFTCLQGTTIDIYLSDEQLPVFLDGPPHKKEVQRIKDETVNAMYLKRYGKTPLRIDYEGTSKKEEDHIIKQIMEATGRKV